MSVDPADYCEVCGDEMVVRLGDHPLCLTHFTEAMRQTGEVIRTFAEQLGGREDGVMDIERLDEELVNLVAGLLSTIPVQPSKLHPEEQVNMAETVVRLVRANGAEPDYEAAAKKLWCNGFGEPWESELFSIAKDKARQEAKAIVDAAIGDRLLVDHPEEGT